MKRLLPSIVILTVLTGCAQLELLRPTPAGDADRPPQKLAVEVGMSSLQVVKTIGFPVSGASLEDCDGLKRDVWVYNQGDLLLIFTEGQLNRIIGPGGDRPSIRLYR